MTASDGPASISSGWDPAATPTRTGPVAGAVATPARARTARCWSASTSRPSRRAIRAGRKATRPSDGSPGGAVDPAALEGPARPVEDQSSAAVRADPGEPGLLALLEAQARLRAEPVALAGPADADRVEDGRLDHDIGRGLADLRVDPAHDPGDGDRAARVGDDQRVLGQGAFHVVEGLHPLALRRPADDDPTAADRAASKVWIGLPSSSIT